MSLSNKQLTPEVLQRRQPAQPQKQLSTLPCRDFTNNKNSYLKKERRALRTTVTEVETNAHVIAIQATQRVSILTAILEQGLHGPGRMRWTGPHQPGVVQEQERTLATSFLEPLIGIKLQGRIGSKF